VYFVIAYMCYITTYTSENQSRTAFHLAGAFAFETRDWAALAERIPQAGRTRKGRAPAETPLARRVTPAQNKNGKLPAQAADPCALGAGASALSPGSVGSTSLKVAPNTVEGRLRSNRSRRAGPAGPLEERYHLTLTPMRATRGATTDWIWLAFAAFWVPRRPWIVLLLVRLNTSSDGTMPRPLNLSGRSTRKSRL